MIEMGKKYQTRDGRAVRVLATDLKNAGALTVVGLITETSGPETIEVWTKDGWFSTTGNLSPQDLVPVPTKHEGWCAVCLNPLWTGHTNIRTEKKTAIDDMRTEAWGDLKKDWTIAHVTWEG